jgi:T-complex protein 1 subunit theta
MLKDGYRHYQGLEEALYRNIEACKAISEITKTSFGVNGMKKMIVNHIDKLIVTNDTGLMLEEMEIQHPAANLIKMAAKMQKEEFGDGSNYTVTLTGELLNNAEKLLRSGLHPSDIITGYELGLEQALTCLENSVAFNLEKIDDERLLKAIESSLAPKMPSYYKHFARVVLEACSAITQDTAPRFNDDSIRICKILGGCVEDSKVLKGWVITRGPESSTLERVENAKVACYRCPFDPDALETKGTVLIENAKDLINFNSSEENYAETLVKGIVEAGVNVVAVGGNISDICLHYLNKYGIFVLKVQSKFELLRLCRLLNARAIPSVKPPTPEDIGYCELVEVQEIGSTKVTVFNKNQVNTNLATIILRGATRTIMDGVESALQNGVSCFKQVLHDGRFLSGASSTECHLVNYIENFSNSLKGLEQYGCKNFGLAFEVFAKILLENAGLNSNRMVPEIVSQNIEKPQVGVDVFEMKLEKNEILQVYDSYASKVNAIKLASKTALTILRIDQIIMAKPSGGPKPKSNSGWDNED